MVQLPSQVQQEDTRLSTFCCMVSALPKQPEGKEALRLMLPGQSPSLGEIRAGTQAGA